MEFAMTEARTVDAFATTREEASTASVGPPGTRSRPGSAALRAEEEAIEGAMAAARAMSGSRAAREAAEARRAAAAAAAPGSAAAAAAARVYGASAGSLPRSTRRQMGGGGGGGAVAPFASRTGPASAAAARAPHLAQMIAAPGSGRFQSPYS